jgi:hypothetical protein
VVVADEHDALQPAPAVQRVLQHHGDERLNLQNLRALLHDQVIVLQTEAQKVLAFQRRVRARHRHHLGLFREQVVGPVARVLQELKRAALLQLGKRAAHVAHAPVRLPRVRLEVRPGEQRLRRVREEAGEREPVGDERGRRRRLAPRARRGDGGVKLFPSRQHVQEPEMPSRLARVRHVLGDAQ